ncbi:hypothetical protein [Kitasatospora viridis]|uniref:Hemolysin type calcium-binding protein n=1 Tax=Kitasatospora viridis TaxID=281105 RepID=A0A561TVW1_9ACTN|nr:hypothetical protein [Kitasatospora viridis]TWF91253.1 hypothetical protein FHX73_12365 [Kitasatospora viridis]
MSALVLLTASPAAASACASTGERAHPAREVCLAEPGCSSITDDVKRTLLRAVRPGGPAARPSRTTAVPRTGTGRSLDGDDDGDIVILGDGQGGGFPDIVSDGGGEDDGEAVILGAGR